MLLTLATAAALNCYPTDDVYDYLYNQIGERRIVEGLTDDGVIIEFWGENGNTFTVFITRPDGMSCSLASGEYHNVNPFGDPA